MKASNELTVVSDTAAWDDWLAANNGHILQTRAWGELKSRFGWRAERLAWAEGGTTVAAAQVLYRRLAPGLTIAYVPRGPIVPDRARVAPFLARLRQTAQGRGAFVLKLEPDWEAKDPHVSELSQARATPSAETIQPPATIRIDLSASLETILARMKPKWRYNIRLSEKKGVTVRAATNDDLPTFYELMRVTGERDHFAIHGADYYRAALELLHVGERACILLAEYAGQPLGTIFVTAFAHEAIYLYGASGNAARNRMPNHALHWAAIQWAKARGCTQYDLWGIPADAEVKHATEEKDGASGAESRTEEPASALPSSLYQFKQGFGGEVVQYTGAWDMVFRTPHHQFYKLARRARRGGLA